MVFAASNSMDLDAATATYGGEVGTRDVSAMAGMYNPCFFFSFFSEVFSPWPRTKTSPSSPLAAMAGLSGHATGAFFLLVFMQTTAILLFKLCQEEGAYTFSPASSIAITEFAKLAMASGLHYRAVDRAELFEGLDARIVLNYAGLALLYTTNNYITFHVHLVADPGTYTLGKSVTPYLVAVLLRLSGDRLHELQWLCIVIQCCGIASTQYDPCASASLLPLSTYALIAFSACITSTCGVWNQKVIKGFGTPVNLQNSVLYFFGCLLASTAYAVPPADGSTRIGFLTGYSFLPVVLICFQAFQGLAVAWVLKSGASAVFFSLFERPLCCASAVFACASPPPSLTRSPQVRGRHRQELRRVGDDGAPRAPVVRPLRPQDDARDVARRRRRPLHDLHLHDHRHEAPQGPRAREGRRGRAAQGVSFDAKGRYDGGGVGAARRRSPTCR